MPVNARDDAKRGKPQANREIRIEKIQFRSYMKDLK